MKKVLLNQKAKIIVKISSRLGDFVQRIQVSDILLFDKNFGLKLDLSILTINNGKWEWVPIEKYELDHDVEMCSRQMLNGGFWIQTPRYLGRHLNIFTGIKDTFPFTCDKIDDYVYLISQYICNSSNRYKIVYDTNTSKNKFEHNFSKHQTTRFIEKKTLLGFQFNDRIIDHEYFFDYKNFDIEFFTKTLFDDFGNNPLEYIEYIKLFDSGFLSQFALMKDYTVKSDFIIPELLWIYLIMYKQEVDLHIPHSNSVWKSLTRNQKVSQLAMSYQKKNLFKLNEDEQGYAIFIDSENNVLVNEGYFLIEV